jgi:hypothetical protein
MHESFELSFIYFPFIFFFFPYFDCVPIQPEEDEDRPPVPEPPMRMTRKDSGGSRVKDVSSVIVMWGGYSPFLR